MYTYKLSNRIACILGAILCLGVGVLAGLATAKGAATWYPMLIQPSFTPPSYVFGPVWTVLYILMGVALGLIYQTPHPDRNKALLWFGIQLIFNALWSFIFFSWHQIVWAAFDLSLIWLTLIVTMFYFYRIYSLAMYLLIPYLLWSSFAWILNIKLIFLNPYL